MLIADLQRSTDTRGLTSTLKEGLLIGVCVCWGEEDTVISAGSCGF